MNPSSDDDALPVWPVATIALLTTMDEAPHAIPVTAPFRAGERHILLALKQTRESLARLRKCPRVSLSIFGSGDLAVTIKAPAGAVPSPYSHRLLAQEPLKVAGGQVRIVDSTNFPAASTIAAALVEIEPGGLRELHWHTNADEWQYFISGSGRMTVFASSGKARTFDYQAGDVGYVPFAMGHYVQNTGTETLSFLEIFRSPRFVDISLNQWMAFTQPELVQAHLNIAPEVIAGLSGEKAVIVR